ncbi:MAG UNVERIFIED_CONTAM: YkgJ family cysteine cluster protein [Planctomycetaceae bacterium]|jgi:lysine-N-methylase
MMALAESFARAFLSAANTMPSPGLLLPVFQNWACHNCGGCCREHVIGITAEEKQQIEAQGWSAADGVPEDSPLFVTLGTGWRINHQPDGACVFLAPNGLCRIHSKFGESAKPLACRLYPYAIHPAGHIVTASLRFSCPSVVQNLGPAVSSVRSTVEALAKEVVPASYRNAPAPDLRPGLPFDWPRMTRLLAWIERGLSDSTIAFPLRLQRVLLWISLLGRAEPEALSDEHFGDLVKLLFEAANRALPDAAAPVSAPNGLARLMFRQFLAQLLRHDTAANLNSSFGAASAVAGGRSQIYFRHRDDSATVGSELCASCVCRAAGCVAACRRTANSIQRCRSTIDILAVRLGRALHSVFSREAAGTALLWSRFLWLSGCCPVFILWH